ncbi:rhodanese-like domain-containing protein [Abyssalbus ytuae]|uniref:Rhodanese-like domain-containing protein n=1 Tax=Abyssalbus ytuae TaxID=2926907 RepID=A0A9E6ZR07_9FLAO|nr:rhodanese-like domain-containing protein [Abyssalbus ytuae]UOB16303.1 rhodanese-like domain-containing protein [Abyssalbus ytuae]
MKKLKPLSVFLPLFVFISCFHTKNEITTLNITDYDTKTNSKEILVDVRTPEEYEEGHLPGAVNIDVLNDNFIKKTGKLKKTAPVYLYCRSGKRSLKAAKILDSLGYKKIYNLDGGFLAWKESGGPVENKKPGEIK